MKLAMMLPLFSEYPMREYLGVELIVRTLITHAYSVDRIDMNERFVDYLMSNPSILEELSLSGQETAQVQSSPYSKYFELYVRRLTRYDSARSMKEDGLYDNFFQSIVLRYFDTGLFPSPSLLQDDAQSLESIPVIRSYFSFLCETSDFSQYDAILMSVPHAHQFFYALLFSKFVKSLHPDITVVLGGSTITLSEDEELDAYVCGGFIDYYVKYSGEEKLLALLVDLEENEEIDQRGLAARSYVDINEQCIAYRTEYEMASVPVLYSRGCYWGKCAYCTYIYLDTGKFIRKDLTVLMDELAQFSNKPVRISLITESLTPQDAKMIAEGILERDIHIRWGSFIRVNQKFDSTLFTLLRKSGCIYSCVGVESVNNTVLGFLNKGYTGEEVHAFFQSAREADFHFFQVNFMYGAPVAQLSDELENIQFISEFRDIIGNIAFFRLEITKKSYMGQHLEELGIAIDTQNARRAIRVDCIPFVPSLNEKEFMILERAYGIAGEHFKTNDVQAGIRLFLHENPKVVPLKDAVVFEFNGHYFAGSLKSFLLREISNDLFSELKAKKELELKFFTQKDLLTLFELNVVDTKDIIYRQRPRVH